MYLRHSSDVYTGSLLLLWTILELFPVHCSVDTDEPMDDEQNVTICLYGVAKKLTEGTCVYTVLTSIVQCVTHRVNRMEENSE